MPLIKETIIYFLTIFFTLISIVSAEELKKIGKFKDWETLVLIEADGLVCFAQTKPVLQSPKASSREARLFVSFRPVNKITDEISTTSGYEFNSQNSIFAKSGKAKYKFDNFSNKSDIRLAQGLLDKCLSLDNNILEAKLLMGKTYFSTYMIQKQKSFYIML